MSDKIKIQIYHCSKCQHEWESGTGTYSITKCDWCGADGNIIDTKEYDFGFIKKLAKKFAEST